MAKPLIQNTAGGGAGGGAASNDGSSKSGGTTFVQADSTCFRDLVQRLTGPSGYQSAAPVIKSPAPKPTQKLHERRKYNKPKIEIAKPIGFQFQPSTSPPLLSPIGGGYRSGWWSYPVSPSSMIMLSPPTSLQSSPISTPSPFGCSKKRASPSAVMELNSGEEEKAIKEKRFYLHPSPRSKPRLVAEPELLTLFPITGPTNET